MNKSVLALRSFCHGYDILLSVEPRGTSERGTPFLLQFNIMDNPLKKFWPYSYANLSELNFKVSCDNLFVGEISSI